MAEKPRRETYEVTADRKGDDEKIKVEVDRIIKKGFHPDDVAKLQDKYPGNDYLIDEVLIRLRKRMDKIRQQAKEVAEKIYRKYASGSHPLHEILEMMKKYKVEHKWSDVEYDEFRKELSYLLTGKRAMEIDYNQQLISQRSRITRTLGTRYVKETGLSIKENEHGVLNEILSMYEKSATLHKSVFMHSLMYEDCSLTALSGEYKKDKHLASNYIHPILACLYIPKFDYFDVHTLYANFGSIVKTRYEKKPIVNEPDSLLFYDITSDPNDVVCEINSPITDLRNRFRVQISLWENVINLRNGKYYEGATMADFMTALNACRSNLYDNADLAYNQDEGAILRRLLSVFSMRPTIIATKPVYSVAALAAGPMGCPSIQASYGIGTAGTSGLMGMMRGGEMNDSFMATQSMLPFNGQPVYTITSVPMITFQIPPVTGEQDEPKDLRTALTQTIWITENKTIIPKEQSIIYSKEVLIFYINRRIQRIQLRTYTNPIAFSQLPLTMSSFERLNTYPVYVPENISIVRDGTYELRSVVAVTETEIKHSERSTNIITGCTGLIMTHRNFEKGRFDSAYYLYDPFGASLPVPHPGTADSTGKCDDQGQWFTNKPISYLPGTFASEGPGGIITQSFHERAKTTGTIFIYAKSTGYVQNEIISI